MLVYIIGAVTFATESELEMFNIAEKILKIKGYDVVNPFKECQIKGLKERLECMEYLIPLLVGADKVCLLPTWVKSYDAKTEMDIVHNLRKHQIMMYDNLINN